MKRLLGILLMVGLLLAALVLPRHALKGVDWAESLGDIVRLRRFWIMVVVSVSINVCWHFLVNWAPTFLKEDRQMTYLASGLFHGSVPGIVSRAISIVTRAPSVAPAAPRGKR